jgi:simple sugar transport system substrate-binding protein
MIRVAAALVVLGSLAACSLTPDRQTPVRFVIGVSHANLTEPWRITMNSEIQDEAALFPGVRLVVADAADSAARQVSDVQRLLDSGIDLLIISPTDSRALTPAVARAHHRVPVILLDRAVEGYDYNLFLGPDNQRIGHLMGAYVAQALGPRGGTVIEVEGRSGSPPVVDRSQGFRESLANAPGVAIGGVVVADWLRDRAQDAMGQLFATHPRVDFVVAQNDAMALGAYRAAADRGLTGLRFVGVDGLPGPDGGIDLVARGVLDATFQCPTGGREAVDYALDILNREPGIPKKIFLRTRIITRPELLDGAALPAPRIVPASRRIVLGYAQTGRESQWREANTESIQAAARESGIDLLFRDADQKQENQIKALREFIARKVDVIALSPLVETGWDDVMAEAKAAGIPVIVSDRTARTRDDSLVTTILGGDFVEEGRRAARWLTDKAGEVKDFAVVELRGTEGSTPAIDRAAGFREVLAAHPGYRIIDSADGDFQKDQGKKVMAGFLRRWGTGIKAVFAHNDDMALGAVEAIQEAGLRPGIDVMVVSIDGVRAAFEAMIAGKLNCSVECSPLLGPQLMKAVKDYALGKELPVRIVTEEGVYPQETAQAALGGRKY